MAADHSEIVQPLGEGWAAAWDSTEIDIDTRKVFAALISDEKTRVTAILSEGDGSNAEAADQTSVDADAEPA